MWSKLLLRQKITWMVVAVCALMLRLFEGVFLKTQQATLQGQAQRSLDGLGLAISQRLVGLMGGVIAMRSEEGQGSEFSFTMRLERCATGPDQDNTMLAPMRVLIVDDNQVNLEILAEQPHSWGCSVVPAQDVRGARLELGNAAGLVEYMQQPPHLAAIPVIMLSSAGMQWHGASDASPPQVLTKPVRQSELTAIRDRES